MSNPTEELLVKEHYGLVVHLAQAMNPPSPTELEEYISVGLMGLLESIRKYDPSIGKLTTYCQPKITWNILNYIRSNAKHKGTIPIKNLCLLESETTSNWKEWLPPSLTKEERSVLEKRFEYGYTMRQINKEVYKSAIAKLRECYDA